MIDILKQWDELNEQLGEVIKLIQKIQQGQDAALKKLDKALNFHE